MGLTEGSLMKNAKLLHMRRTDHTENGLIAQLHPKDYNMTDFGKWPIRCVKTRIYYN
jgi:hypothetical protein